METALINTLRAQPAFGGFAVAPVAPRVADGGRAVGVRLDPAPSLGSLSRGRVTVTIVCPRDDDDNCRTLVNAVLAWRATHEFTASDRAWRVVRIALVDTARTQPRTATPSPPGGSIRPTRSRCSDERRAHIDLHKRARVCAANSNAPDRARSD